MHPPIRYHVRITDPHTHKFHVRMEIPGAAGWARVTVPSWAPGSYLMREFARQVVSFDVVGGSARKVAKGTWEVRGDGDLVVEYTFNAQELSVRTPYLDDEFGFFVGTNALAYVEGALDRPAEVRFELPSGWSAFSSRFPDFRGERFSARDYDELADCAVLFAPAATVSMERFDVCGKAHGFLFVGRGEMDVPRIVAESAACVQTSADLFGNGELPYERYLFVQIYTADYRGGLEHCDSSVLAYPRTRYRTEDDHRDFMFLVAHEFFHVWNVKRVHSDVLGPFDYANENYTRDLWVAEGWTSYYQNVIALRAGVCDEEAFLDALGKRIAAHERKPAREVEDLETSSFDAWIKLYRPDGDTPNRTISYYLKGSLVAFLLDLEIRRRSAGEKSLFDVFAHLWHEFGKRGVGYPEGTIQAQIEASVGGEWDGFFERFIRGTAPLPWADALATVGLVREDVPAEPALPWLGATLLDDADGGVRIKTAFAAGPARTAGLMTGDVIAAVDRYRTANPTALDDVLHSRKGGDVVEIAFFRRGELRNTQLTLAEPQPKTVRLVRAEDADEAALQRQSEWLRGA